MGLLEYRVASILHHDQVDSSPYLIRLPFLSYQQVPTTTTTGPSALTYSTTTTATTTMMYYLIMLFVSLVATGIVNIRISLSINYSRIHQLASGVKEVFLVVMTSLAALVGTYVFFVATLWLTSEVVGRLPTIISRPFIFLLGLTTITIAMGIKSSCRNWVVKAKSMMMVTLNGLKSFVMWLPLPLVSLPCWYLVVATLLALTKWSFLALFHGSGSLGDFLVNHGFESYIAPGLVIFLLSMVIHISTPVRREI